MKHFDTFSGYGGFALPAREMGWETIGFAEIDKYASAVLEYNFRGIKNYGDISEIDFRQFHGEVDLITGGTPCQDLSVAGKQAGLDGTRSGLFFEFIRALTECEPRHFIWENVKGSLSSSRGWDMARVQIEMAQAGYAVEWRVLNATEFSVPQNRERIFIIGTRGESGREILPLPEGTGQTLKELTGGMSQGYRVYDNDGVATAQAPQAGGLGAKTGLYAIDLCEAAPKVTEEVRTIQARYHKGYSNRKAETSGVIVREATKKGYDIATEGDSINFSVPSSKTRRGRVGKGVANTLDTASNQATLDGCRIRRLTPTECERLMGLPDGWTSKGVMDGKEVDISDTQRYKMCGNGVVTNVVKAIYERIEGWLSLFQ